MAYDNRGSNLPGVVAAADYSTTGQNRFVSLDASGKVALTGAGEAVDGVLEGDPGLDQAASVMGPGSVSRVEASAAIAAGAAVASAASGQAVTAGSGDYIAGKALNAVGASGELVSVWLTMPGRLA